MKKKSPPLPTENIEFWIIAFFIAVFFTYTLLWVLLAVNFFFNLDTH